MRNKLTFIVFLCCAIFYCSCTEVLDVAPDGSLTDEEIWKDPYLVESMLNACYRNIPQRGYKYFYHNNNITAVTDDAVASGTAGPAQLVYADYVTASFHPLRDQDDSYGAANCHYWQRCWEQIRLCTQFIQNIDTAAVNHESNRELMKAEARILRAYFYSELVKWFGRVPLVDPLMAIDDDFSSLRRESVYTVAKYIETDCMLAAESALPWRRIEADEAMRVTKALAHTIRAKMLLYAASPLHNEGKDHWEEAYQATKEAVTLMKLNGYELFTECTLTSTFGTGKGAAFRQLMCTPVVYSANSADRETIWQHKEPMTSGPHVFEINYIGSNLKKTNKCGACPTQELVDAFDTSDGVPVLDLARPYLDEKHLQPNYNPANTLYDPDDPYSNRDPRMYQTVLLNGDVIIFDNEYVTVETYVGGRHGIIGDPTNEDFTRTGYYHQKFVLPGSSESSGHNPIPWKIYRFAEVLLDYAEAAANYGELGEAKAALDEVRARVDLPPLPDGMSQDEMILRAHKERRTELAWEEQRYFDLRRWQEPDGDLGETCRWVTAMQIEKREDGTFKYTRIPAHDSPRGGSGTKDLLMPIPFDEASRLEYLTGFPWQNPGW